MNAALKVLKERGFFKQCTNEELLDELLDKGAVRFYAGFDPTGPSLHCGHLVPLFAMAHLQQFGHKPIALVGGGTARIGDPSGKTEMRKMLTVDQVRANAESLKGQISRFIRFDRDKALLLDNAEWLEPLKYLDFLRDIGRHFSVNKMLTFESYRKRMETGLSFIEFSYQLLQSYDYLILRREYGCMLQIGGDDQWGNIVAGVFLDPSLTPVYDFFQYWRNVADADVGRFLKLYTFLPAQECEALGARKDAGINEAKEILAYELTKIIHGEEEADKARAAARAVFGGAGGDREGIPSLEIAAAELENGIGILDLFARTALCGSKGEARRLIAGGGAMIGDLKVTDERMTVTAAFAVGGEIILKAGKKRFFRIKIV